MVKGVCVFHKEGYCAAGDHCQFSHDIPTVPCRVFFDTGKCKFGSACAFSHRKEERIVGVRKPLSTPTKSGPPLDLSTPSIAEELKPPEPETGFDHKNLIESLWNHEQGSDKSDGAYFYGAVGTFSGSDSNRGGAASGPITQQAGSWASVAKKFAEIDQEPKRVEGPGIKIVGSRKREICNFFSTGNCRFGSRCINIHTLDGGNTDVRESGGENSQILAGAEDCGAEDQPVDCGICYSQRPEDGMYGVLNGCDCVFCLKCIRGWRTTHGKEVASTSSQVRLCPLCRIESHFIIPSMVSCKRSPRKDLLIQNYRSSLKKIPCKYLYSGGVAGGAEPTCPYGNSCFYLHRDDDKLVVHHILNKNGEVEVRGTGQDLFSFVKKGLERKVKG